MIKKAMLLFLLAALLGCNDAQQSVVLGGMKSYRFPTTAMEPTINKDEYAFAEQYAQPPTPKRGDVIVFRYPLQPETLFAKRVVALPGETVEIRRKQLYVNGAQAIEPFVRHQDQQVYPDNPRLPEPFKSRDHFGPMTLNTNEFFVLGDNRDRSSDSRYWGPVPRANIIGKIVKAGDPSGPLRPVE